MSIHFLQAQGFCSGTLVKIPSGYVAIEQLSVGDLVVCCDHENKLVTRPIYHVAKRIQNTYVQLDITDTLLCGDSYFFKKGRQVSCKDSTACNVSGSVYPFYDWAIQFVYR